MTLEEQIAHYAAIKKRLRQGMVIAPPVVAKPEPEPEIVEPAKAGMPVQLTGPMRFRKHVMQISKLLDVNPEILFTSSRKRQYTMARFEIFYYLVVQGQWPYMRVGRWLGYDHTTIMHGVKRIKEMIKRGTYEPRLVYSDTETLGFESLTPGSGDGDRAVMLRANGLTGSATNLSVLQRAGVCEQASDALGGDAALSGIEGALRGSSGQSTSDQLEPSQT